MSQGFKVDYGPTIEHSIDVFRLLGGYPFITASLLLLQGTGKWPI